MVLKSVKSEAHDKSEPEALAEFVRLAKSASASDSSKRKTTFVGRVKSDQPTVKATSRYAKFPITTRRVSARKRGAKNNSK